MPQRATFLAAVPSQILAHAAEWSSVILSLVLVEALLSVDNVLAIVAIARALPEREQARARAWGMALGVVFRILALLLATLLIAHPTVRYLGAAYLVWLCLKHFLLPENELEAQRGPGHFRKVVLAIAVADIAFSLDNVVAAVGLTANVPLVVAGVLVGIVTMFFASAIVARVVRRYPQLADVAFLIVGFIGVAMATEQALGVEIRPTAKFLVILGMIAVTVAYDEGKRRRVRRS